MRVGWGVMESDINAVKGVERSSWQQRVRLL